MKVILILTFFSIIERIESLYVGDYNILVLNDMHYMPNYTQEIDLKEGNCYIGSCLNYG